MCVCVCVSVSVSSTCSDTCAGQQTYELHHCVRVCVCVCVCVCLCSSLVTSLIIFKYTMVYAYIQVRALPHKDTDMHTCAHISMRTHREAKMGLMVSACVTSGAVTGSALQHGSGSGQLPVSDKWHTHTHTHMQRMRGGRGMHACVLTLVPVCAVCVYVCVCVNRYFIQDLFHTTVLASFMGLTEPARNLSRDRPLGRVLSAGVILPVIAQVRYETHTHTRTQVALSRAWHTLRPAD